MQNEEDNYRSLNKETGLLEDIEEVRLLGTRMTQMILTLVRSPLIAAIMPPELRLDVVGLAASAETMFRKTSQAEYLRLMGTALGMNPFETDMMISLANMSETLPSTHPDATKPNLPPLDPNDPFVRRSVLLSQVAQEENKEKPTTQPHTPSIVLPPGLEEFLDMLQKPKEE